MSVILNRREAATVLAGLRLLAGDGVRVPNYPYVLVAGLCDETDPEYGFSSTRMSDRSSSACSCPLMSGGYGQSID